MSKKLAILLIFVSAQSFATTLNSFNEIYQNVSNGKNIKLVINFDACDPKPSVSNVQVYLKPTAIMLRESYLQFSNSPLTTNNPAYPNKPILENVTYKLMDDNQLYVTVKSISLPDYTVINQSSSACALNTAVRVYN